MIYAYNNASGSAKALAEALGIKRISHNNSKYTGGEDKIVINWGSSSLPEEVRKSMIVNRPERVEQVSNKLLFFTGAYDSFRTPPWTVEAEVARQWLEEGSTVFLRDKLDGHSGEGIIVLDKSVANHLKDGSLFVKYIPKKDEYRVHVVNGEVIDVRKKAIKNGNPNNANFKIRSYNNGWIFKKNDINPPEDVITQALAAVENYGLDFGAVDVIWNQYRNQAFVLEINTAPGLEGSTTEEYAKAFQKLFENHQRKLNLPNEQIENFVVQFKKDLDSLEPCF